jgi:hypothetical protein
MKMDKTKDEVILQISSQKEWQQYLNNLRDSNIKEAHSKAKEHKIIRANFIERWLLGYFDNNERWGAFCWLVDNCKLSKRAFNVGLKEAWTTGRGDIKAIKYFGKSERKYLMDNMERAYYKKLPNIVTIYRGCNKLEYEDDDNFLGLSWTTERKVAEFFAFRNRGCNINDGRVYSVNISKLEISAIFLDRHEYEVIYINLFPDKEQIYLVTDKPTDYYYSFIKELEQQNKQIQAK